MLRCVETKAVDAERDQIVGVRSQLGPDIFSVSGQAA
jgi:hypothetical protein